MDRSGAKDRVSTRPSPLACVECRKAHLKCDAASPTCSRCSKQGLICNYTPSRRGQRPKTSERPSRSGSFAGWNASSTGSNQATSTQIPTLIPTLSPRQGVRAPAQNMNSLSSPLRPFAINTGPSSSSSAANAWNSQNQLVDQSTRAGFASFQEDNHLVNLYYTHLHPVHPFLLPQSHYKTAGYPKHLRVAIQYVGSHYAFESSESIRNQTVDAILSEIEDGSVALVQTFLLLGMVFFHTQLDIERGQMALSRACAIAINLGMDREESLSLIGGHDPLVRESIRRTWWELYVIEGYCTALHRQPMFPHDLLEPSVSLPCHEEMFLRGEVPNSSSNLSQFDQRLFSNNELEFSPGTYRIDAARILRRANSMMGSKDGGTPREIRAIDNALSVWSSHLSQDKMEAVDSYGRVDQMMHQAHSFIRFTQILVHFPRSDLLNKILPAVKIACINVESNSPTSAQHAHKAITAANEIADLAALQTPLYSPLFICSLVFATIIQLSACSAHSHTCHVEHRERLALMTGVLKKISRSWVLAQSVLHHLNNIASAVFSHRELSVPRASPASGSLDSGFDTESIADTLAFLDQTFGLDFEASIDEEWMSTVG